MEMLIEVDQSATDPRTWIETALRDGRRIPGFGHRVYDVKDPRAKILDEKSAMLGEAGGDDRWYEMSVVIEDYPVTKGILSPTSISIPPQRTIRWISRSTSTLLSSQ